MSARSLDMWGVAVDAPAGVQQEPRSGVPAGQAAPRVLAAEHGECRRQGGGRVVPVRGRRWTSAPLTYGARGDRLRTRVDGAPAPPGGPAR